MSFRPYSEADRVVSDSSRFEFDHITPRNRSRNPSPTTIDDGKSTTTFSTIIPPYSSRINKNLQSPSVQNNYDDLSYHNSRHPSIKEFNDEEAQQRFSSSVYPDQLNYEKQREQKTSVPPTPPIKDYKYYYNQVQSHPPQNQVPPKAQYPTQQQQRQSYESSRPPMQEQTPYNTSHTYDIDLPPQTTPATYYGRPSSDGDKPKTVQKQIEHDLVKRVMNPDTWTIRRKQEIDQDNWVDVEYSVSLFAVLHVFEGICGIITISLSSILLDRDDSIDPGYYRYLLSDSIITLAISFLLLTKAVNYESRNGVFYSILATTMKIVSFIIVTAVIIPNHDCHVSQACPMRKALSSFIIICTFLWLVNCVIFLTTVYISHLDLLRKIPNPEINDVNDALPPQPTPGGEMPPYETNDEKSGPPLKEYFLNDKGEMYELTNDINTANKRKVIVYM